MKKILLLIATFCLITGCNKDEQMEELKYKTMVIEVNNHRLLVNLENNKSVKALLEKLDVADITVNASDYGNFEKVGSLGFNLPRTDKNITTKPGDVILYQGSQITIYYDENTWNFTKLGSIDISKEELIKILGSGDVTFTLRKESK